MSRANKKWLGATLLGAVALLAVYWFSSRRVSPRGSTPIGHGLGILGLALFTWLGLYSVRKRTFLWRWGRLDVWLKAHLYLGALAALAAALHTGFHIGGVLSLAIAVLVGVVVLSGVFGSYIYYFAPAALGRLGEPVRSREQLESRVKAQRKKIASGVLQVATTPGQATVGGEHEPHRSALGRAGQILRSLHSRSDGRARGEKGGLESNRRGSSEADLSSLYDQLLVMRLLEGWVRFHAALSAALGIAVTAHIVVVLYY